MSFSFLKQIGQLEQDVRDLSTQIQEIRTTQQSLTNELQHQRLTLQKLEEQIKMQRIDFTRDLQQLQPESIPVVSKNLSELHAMHIEKTRMTSEAISDLETIYQEFDQVYEAAKQERDQEQENLVIVMDKLFSSTRNTDQMGVIRKEEENPSEMS